MPSGDSRALLAVIGIGLLVLWWDDPVADAGYVVILLTVWLLSPHTPDRSDQAPEVEQLPQ